MPRQSRLHESISFLHVVHEACATKAGDVEESCGSSDRGVRSPLTGRFNHQVSNVLSRYPRELLQLSGVPDGLLQLRAVDLASA